MAHIGQVTEEANGNLKVTRNGQVLVLHPPRTKDVAEAEEVMALRHFLERSESSPPAENGKESHWLLVIDHHEARIFRSEMDDVSPQQIMPPQPDDFFRHAQDSKEFSRGREKPDPNSFFGPVAKALQSAGKILVFGNGKGMGSEMEQFVAWSQTHHPELARRIVGSVAVDEQHLTQDQLLARARAFFAGLGKN
jgi:hypothetical protein